MLLTLMKAKLHRATVTQADLDWLDAHRVEPGKDYPGAVELVRQMRDESY